LVLARWQPFGRVDDLRWYRPGGRIVADQWLLAAEWRNAGCRVGHREADHVLPHRQAGPEAGVAVVIAVPHDHRANAILAGQLDRLAHPGVGRHVAERTVAAHPHAGLAPANDPDVRPRVGAALLQVEHVAPQVLQAVRAGAM